MLLLGVSIVLSAFLAFGVMTLPIAGDSFLLFGVLVLESVFSILLLVTVGENMMFLIPLFFACMALLLCRITSWNALSLLDLLVILPLSDIYIEDND